ncbi:hypothetical protein Caci_3544 [Catenulispora acidiphila DSM 44928]|uniref:Uncharacterized protein n=1 Tax=Catenulispora acidiphila (strain DSM 44928 / JCM 14897 / NBRC 102108 / NRRL B-24433 / ID139908) TaxID=479433 RepID=C7QAF0_CATAD|nr:hypothetical protein [Catenulispora acidiphila]ACU72449.1 hypothetical protein Caci_3544 [Catenulispora acidiphila DSM 44928]
MKRRAGGSGSAAPAVLVAPGLGGSGGAGCDGGSERAGGIGGLGGADVFVLRRRF